MAVRGGHVPAIWATQVLDTLARTGVPSRAEVTDAAASVAAECVMLNKGPFVDEAVRVLVRHPAADGEAPLQEAEPVSKAAGVGPGGAIVEGTDAGPFCSTSQPAHRANTTPSSVN